MNYSKIFLYCILSMMLAFSACKKDEISEVTETVEQVEVESNTTNPLVEQMQLSVITNTGLDLGCFLVNYPFDLDLDGTIVTINSNEDFEAALLDEPEFMDFVYPISITYTDGETEDIADGEALGNAFANCIPDVGWNQGAFPAFLISDESSCYTMVYPVNLVDADGNVVVANDEDELVDLISTNYTLSFEFPLSLLDEEGNTVTADDDEGLFQLLFECEEDTYNPGGPDPFFYDCWDYSFPFNMVDQDGNIVVINNHDEICNALLNGLELEYVYPLTLVNGDGDELVVNDEAELNAAWADCIGGFDPGDVELGLMSFIFQSDILIEESCYSINYPLAYTNTQSGATGTIDDETAAMAYIEDMSSDFFDTVDFPVTVTEVATGDQITFEDLDAYFQYTFTCF